MMAPKMIALIVCFWLSLCSAQTADEVEVEQTRQESPYSNYDIASYQVINSTDVVRIRLAESPAALVETLEREQEEEAAAEAAAAGETGGEGAAPETVTEKEPEPEAEAAQPDAPQAALA